MICGQALLKSHLNSYAVYFGLYLLSLFDPKLHNYKHASLDRATKLDNCVGNESLETLYRGSPDNTDFGELKIPC